ncbi:MAG: hypothetical protein AMK75_04810 [Planctomycetes bacterium SM23_65]|nr:MAG: hypothetical protein AMK75_04810 [Planctomycetes bacterium SM23_65]
MCALAVPLLVATLATVQASELKTIPNWVREYDGRGRFRLYDPPLKDQGLKTLLSRGRVKPEERMTVSTKGGVTWASDRTIFRDSLTGAEVWRLTNIPSGVIRHSYSGVPAWNANGRFIQFNILYRAGWLFDQEKCTLRQARVGGQWSPTEPNMLFTSGQWKGTKAVLAYDIKQQKALHPLGPVRTYAGICPISADGKWVAWREGTQDRATTFGLAAADGSAYKSIATHGGIVVERSPVTLDPLPDPPSLEVTRGGIHQMYFTRRTDHSVETNVHGDDPHARYFTPDGKMFAGTENLTHQSWHPEGKYVLFMKGGLVGMEPVTKKRWMILQVARAIEGHTTWNSFDPDWAAMSWRSRTGGEIIRVSMRDDHSVARLAASCPVNPDTTAYNNDEFACMSPDGTKILFMSTMSGSVNEYLVVAANPRAPRLAGKWTDAGYQLTVTPDPLSREIKRYRVYRTRKSGRAYQEIGAVDRDPDAAIDFKPMAYVVKDARKGDGAFYAVRAQEWSGLISRYSNDVSGDGEPVARTIEPETLDFTGFKQAFDPLAAGDLYYLFVPKDDAYCSVSFSNDNRNAAVWARVKGMRVTFAVNGRKMPERNYDDWTWVDLGRLIGKITIVSSSAGFRLDRVFIAPDGTQAPKGRGSDYERNAAFAARTPEDVQAKALTPFAVQLTWKPVPGARYYNVHAGVKPDFTPGQNNLLYSPPVGTEKTIDWGLKPGTTHYYRVVAVEYDDTPTRPSAAAVVKTPPIEVRTVTVEYESGTGATVEDDASASSGKAVLLKGEKTCTVKFNVPADDDYVIWHAFRADSGRAVRCEVELDGVKSLTSETYDLAALGGRSTRRDWVWSRYRFLWSKQINGVLPLKAGEHTLSITAKQPIHLDRMIITNDRGLVPEGKLCTF